MPSFLALPVLANRSSIFNSDGMKVFIKLCLLFSIPFFLLGVAYVWFDPFKVIGHYDNYYVPGDGGSVNRNFVSTMNYLNKKDTYHYDSFIFGNSRSLFYRIEDWKKHLAPESSCYHFSESSGSINGLYYKLKLIDERGGSINNALLVVDHGLLRRMEQDGVAYIMPPALTGNRNWLRFHGEHFMQWLNPRFLVCWAEFQATGKYKSYMTDFVVKGVNYKYYDPVTNEEPRGYQDSLLKAGTYYTKGVINGFKGKQTPSTSRKMIDKEEKLEKLMEMRKIFDKHHTNYKFIISPLYDQVKVNPEDYQTLCDIFGKEHIYDYSGVNAWTSDYHNYYEWSHYLPSIAAEVMDDAYSH